MTKNARGAPLTTSAVMTSRAGGGATISEDSVLTVGAVLVLGVVETVLYAAWRMFRRHGASEVRSKDMKRSKSWSKTVQSNHRRSGSHGQTR